MDRDSAVHASVRRLFLKEFSREPTLLACAPGRVNLIGEHTDYNDGLVLPVAIDRQVAIAARPNGENRIHVVSSAYADRPEIPTFNPGSPTLPLWARYTQGVAVKMAARGIRLTGFDAAISGDLPIGAGLSSSAALQVASALVLEATSGHALLPRDRALLCHAAEVEFVGVPSGIMDQFASTLCRRGHALFLDCRSLDTHHIPLRTDLAIAVCDTREECAQAVRALRDRGAKITSLRDLSPDDLPQIAELPTPLRQRARHVVTENARVIETARLMEGAQVSGLREVFAASHRSLRDDYEVSGPELDAMVEAALDAPGCLAARMTGGGFGGAAVALVDRSQSEAFLDAVSSGYARRTHREGKCFLTDAADGARGLT